MKGIDWPLIVCFFVFQEVDEFFEQEKTFLLDYSGKIKDATAKAEKMTRSHKSENVVLTETKSVLTFECIITDSQMLTVLLLPFYLKMLLMTLILSLRL